MPARPLRPCPHPGCSRLTLGGRCEDHRPTDARGTRRKKYDLRSWRDRTRPQQLASRPLCENCEAQGLVVAARHVDHRDGNSDNDSPANLCSLCPSCHSSKTALRDGGFGRERVT